MTAHHKYVAMLPGIRGQRMDIGDTIEFKPYGMCTVLFISPVE